MEINTLIKQFASFINNSYDDLSRLVANIDKKYYRDLSMIVEDGFYQFMWEIIVETQLFQGENALEPYGNGADFYGISSRVTYPDRCANHRIIVNVCNQMDFISKKIIQVQSYDFTKLVNYDGKFYDLKKPFDFVLCDDEWGNNFLFKLEEVDFVLKKIEISD